MILVQSPTGNILVNEQNGVVLDEQALRSMARQTALVSGLNPDAFEAQIAATTGFDPSNMKSATGAFDPQAYFASAVSSGGGPGPMTEDQPQQGSPRVVPNTPGAPTAPYATSGQPSGSATEAPPPGGEGLIPGGYTTPEQRAAELALLQAQIAKLTDPTAKATAEAQLQQILAQTANIGAGTGASARASIINSQNALAEQARQFNEKFGMEKAASDQKAAADAADRALKEQQGAASLDVQRGNTLLGLGSRPETLIRYLYALRGAQAPQQLGGVTPALPGYPGVNALPTPAAGVSAPPVGSAVGGSSTPPALAGAPMPAGAPSFPGIPSSTGTPTPYAAGTSQLANGPDNPALNDLLRRAGGGTQPFMTTPLNQFGPNFDVRAPMGTDTSQKQWDPTHTYQIPTSLIPRITQGAPGFDPSVARQVTSGAFTQGPVDPALAADMAANPGDYGGRKYEQGGVIPEHVMGVGMDSGQPYEFGEKGTEAVVSNDMLQRLMEVADKVDYHHKDADGKSERITLTLNGAPKLGKPKSKMPMPGKMNSYAAGGTIGYSGGKNDYNPAVFNPPALGGIVGQGFNTPGIPLPPQVNMLTGGGQSLIPSAQTLHNALPSEVGAYSGFLTDEAGVQPNDVFALAKRLAPTATGVRTPSYGG